MLYNNTKERVRIDGDGADKRSFRVFSIFKLQCMTCWIIRSCYMSTITFTHYTTYWFRTRIGAAAILFTNSEMHFCTIRTDAAFAATQHASGVTHKIMMIIMVVISEIALLMPYRTKKFPCSQRPTSHGRFRGPQSLMRNFELGKNFELVLIQHNSSSRLAYCHSVAVSYIYLSHCRSSSDKCHICTNIHKHIHTYINT